MIGRKYEVQIIKDAINSSKAELGIIYGRRRVGKSYLLKSQVNPKQEDIFFEAVKGLKLKKQIEHFCKQMAEQINSSQIKGDSWVQAIECKFKENALGSEVQFEVENKIKALKLPKKISIEKVLIAAYGVTLELESSNYFNKIFGLEIFYK